MITAKKKNGFQVLSETYSLRFLADRSFVNVDSSAGDRLAEVFVLSSIHTLQGRNDTSRIGQWEFDKLPGLTTVLWHMDDYRLIRESWGCYRERHHLTKSRKLNIDRENEVTGLAIRPSFLPAKG